MLAPSFPTGRMERVATTRAKCVAVLSSQQQLQALREALRDSPFMDLDCHVSNLGAIRPSLVNSHAPDILLVDLGPDPSDTVTELARMLHGQAADLQVLVTGHDTSVDTIRTLMRLGVSDFIPQPLNRADVLAALDTAFAKLSAPDHQAKRGRIVAFARSCGGVGATTLAIQTAAELASGRRRSPSSVCLADFDLQFGNVAFSLDLKADVGLLQVLEAPGRLDAEFLRSVTTRHPAGIDIIAAPGRIVPIDALSPGIATDVVTQAAQIYDYVVVDLPHVWSNWTLGIVKVSDVLVLVTEVNISSLHRCQKILELLEQQELEDLPLEIIANRFDGGWMGKSRQSKSEKALGRRIDWLVRRDADVVAEARDRGVLLQQVRSRSRVEKDLRPFVDHLIEGFSRHAAAAGSSLAQTLGD